MKLITDDSIFGQSHMQPFLDVNKDVWNKVLS